MVSLQILAIVAGENFGYKLCISTYLYDIFANHFLDATISQKPKPYITLPAIGDIPCDVCHSQNLVTIYKGIMNDGR